MDPLETSVLHVLNPDDKLMEKFQKTLHEHLLRIDNRLSEEIYELETSIKLIEKDLEAKGTCLYRAQQEVEHQHATITQYIEALTRITLLTKKKNNNIEEAKDILKTNRTKLDEAKNKKEKLTQELKNLTDFSTYLSIQEKHLNDFLLTSKQMSQQDANKKKELIKEKQQRDFILYHLKEEVWKIETEIAHLDEQLQIKDREKEDANKMIIDANTDLEALHNEHRDLHDTWKSVVNNICNRNSVHDQLHLEQEKEHKSYNALVLEIRNIKQATEKEMETNEHLSSLSFRIENDIKNTSRVISSYNEKVANIEQQLLNINKIIEQEQHNYNVISAQYQDYIYEEEQANKKFKIVSERKNDLEDAMFQKLKEKVISDKTAHYVNELLLNAKDSLLEQEVLLARVENIYGNSLLERERLTHNTEDQKEELQEHLKKSLEKEKQLEEVQKEIRKYEITIERKQRKFLGINKLIDQISPSVGDTDLSPQDLKIMSLEKNIQELQQNIQKAQQFWMRQQGFMVSLSQQREEQLRKLNLLSKEIMIMEQKNLKLEHTLETLAKEETNANKTIAFLEQKLSRMNADLIMQKDLKDNLEDKNCIMKNECILSFQELELDLIKLQNDLKHLSDEKIVLKEELKSAQQESLSWEKKVQLTQDTVKQIKDEHNTGGIALMKSEIHKMETRLSYLRKIQEKLIHDMELCVARRDIILDKVIGKLKKNPKEKHNEKIVINKRLSDQRTKLKQILKITKQTGNTIQEFQSEMKIVQEKFMKSQEDLKRLKQYIPHIENEIKQMELMKYYNLHSLVLKQRKAKQLRDIKSGAYRMTCKNESVIEENLQTEHIYRQHLKCVIEKTDHDFPNLKASLQKILLTLQIL